MMALVFLLPDFILKCKISESPVETQDFMFLQSKTGEILLLLRRETPFFHIQYTPCGGLVEPACGICCLHPVPRHFPDA